MQRSWGVGTVAAGFPWGKLPEFPMGEIYWDNTVVKKIVTFITACSARDTVKGMIIQFQH